jgi:hypothetical protein
MESEGIHSIRILGEIGQYFPGDSKFFHWNARVVLKRLLGISLNDVAETLENLEVVEFAANAMEEFKRRFSEQLAL